MRPHAGVAHGAGGHGQGQPAPPLGLYIVHAPSEEWCPALKEAVHDVYLGGPSRRRKRRRVGSGHPHIHVLDPLSAADPKQAAQISSKAQDILSHGMTVIVIASKLSAVPTALQRASDRIIKVPPPRRQFVSALVREIIPGARRLEFRDLACEMLTPSLLRLAYRRGTSARAFLRRLRTLTSPVTSAGSGKSVPLDKLHGVDEVKRWAMDLKADLTRYRRGELGWHEVTRGLLLAGPPGTAKTTLARSIADFCGLAFVSCSYAEWQRSGEGHLGDVLQAMAASFDEARARAPAILFIDEANSFGARNQGGQNKAWWRSLINGMLEQLDGGTDNEGVVFMGATNHPELIDPAILRSGRMEELITLRPPNPEALAKIYHDQLESEIDEAVDLQQIAWMSAGMTGADVVKVCNTARRRARNAQRPVRYEDLLTALTGKEAHAAPEMRLRIALHEAGHAIAALEFPELVLQHVSIIGQGNKSGATSMGLKAKTQMTPTAVSAQLTAILAGRAAEEILLGEISAGSGGGEGCDLSHATQLAASAELSLGIREQGLIWYAPPSAEELGQLFAQRPDIERMVRERLDQAYGRARELIRAKGALVRRLADQLLTDKVMTGDEVAALIREASRADLSPPPNPGTSGSRLH